VTPTARGAGATLEEVAALAGVSRATVSRVVNGSSKVSERVRTAVGRAVEELGYVPNRAARSLVTRRTDTLALVVVEPTSLFFSDPFFAGTIRGIGSELGDSRYQLVLLMAQTRTELGRVEHYLLNGHADGALIMSLRGRDPLPQRLIAGGVCTVLAGRPLAGADVGYVAADTVGGGRDAAAYLIRQGRRRVAAIAGPADTVPGADRLTGYEKALAEAGMRTDKSLIEAGDFTRESGVRAMSALLARQPDLDAVFAASDLLALGALDVLRRTGRRVPEDVAVVGFDDSELARSAEPPLTTVRQPMEEIGREMVRLMLAQLDHGAPPGGVVLATELVVRRSA
jgi:DNA-binding LacI/PurR family transcriptional regulator